MAKNEKLNNAEDYFYSLSAGNRRVRRGKSETFTCSLDLESICNLQRRSGWEIAAIGSSSNSKFQGSYYFTLSCNLLTLLDCHWGNRMPFIAECSNATANIETPRTSSCQVRSSACFLSSSDLFSICDYLRKPEIVRHISWTAYCSACQLCDISRCFKVLPYLFDHLTLLYFASLLDSFYP